MALFLPTDLFISFSEIALLLPFTTAPPSTCPPVARYACKAAERGALAVGVEASGNTVVLACDYGPPDPLRVLPRGGVGGAPKVWISNCG